MLLPAAEWTQRSTTVVSSDASSAMILMWTELKFQTQKEKQQSGNNHGGLEAAEKIIMQAREIENINASGITRQQQAKGLEAEEDEKKQARELETPYARVKTARQL